MLDERITRQYCAKTFCQTTRLVMPVSSSIVMNAATARTRPLADEDDPRRLQPAAVARAHRLGAGDHAALAQASRRKATGWRRSDRPVWL